MAVRDKIAGKVVADRDKTARAEAIHDKIAEEAADDNTIDPSVELAILEAAELAVDPFVGLAVLEAVDRVDEETGEDIVEETVINSNIEATIDNTVDPSIEAIQSRRTNRQRS